MACATSASSSNEGSVEVTRVYVGIGSNVDRRDNIRAALERLRSLFPLYVKSAVYDTKAVGFDGDDFYNLVIGFDTDVPLAELDALLHTIEADMGRDRTGPRYGARTLDLDLLLYGDVVNPGGDVELPREDIERFAFVLAPLAEIAPQERHPVTGKTFARMWQDFDPRQKLALRATTEEL